MITILPKFADLAVQYPDDVIKILQLNNLDFFTTNPNNLPVDPIQLKDFLINLHLS